MECFVTLPNATLVNIVLENTKAKGQELMDKVCQILGIIEQDYFGLVYKAGRGENLYLNLRNRLDRQLLGPAPHRLVFKVKFYIPPHNIQQMSTKNQFYDQVKMDLESRKLVLENEEQLRQVVALVAQADFGKYDKRTIQLNMYKKLYLTFSEEEDEELTSAEINAIVELHMQLRDMSKESAQYQLLQMVAQLPTYGVELHEATCGSNTHVGLGPQGVQFYNTPAQLTESVLYPVVTKAEHVGKTCVLKVVNDNGTEREIVLRLGTQCAANALYRCITEMHSFYCCDTVHSDVSSQFSRDLKGTLASIFNEKTTLGRDYVFDIKRTLRETIDHTRRMIYQSSQTGVLSSESTLSDREQDDSDCETVVMDTEERCQVLEDTLEKIKESFICCVCRDNELTGALVPCGHLTCIDCAEKLAECPLCRKPIEDRHRIYLPTAHCDSGVCRSSSISLKTATPKHRHCGKRKRPYTDTLAVHET